MTSIVYLDINMRCSIYVLTFLFNDNSNKSVLLSHQSIPLYRKSHPDGQDGF